MFEAQMHVLWQFRADPAAPGSQRRAMQRVRERAHPGCFLQRGTVSRRLPPVLVEGCNMLAVDLNPRKVYYDPILREQQGRAAGGFPDIVERRLKKSRDKDNKEVLLDRSPYHAVFT